MKLPNHTLMSSGLGNSRMKTLPCLDLRRMDIERNWIRRCDDIAISGSADVNNLKKVYDYLLEPGGSLRGHAVGNLHHAVRRSTLVLVEYLNRRTTQIRHVLL